MFARADTSGGGWAIEELDAQTRDRAAAAASALGLGLSEYLSQLMLALALEDDHHLASGLPTDVALETGSRLQEVERAFDARFSGLERRMDSADASVSQTLTEQCERLTQGVEARIEAALSELRAATELAAGRADAASASLTNAMRDWRAAMEAERSEETAAAQFALTEAHARIDDLSTTISANDVAVRAALRDQNVRAADAAHNLAEDVRAHEARLQETNGDIASLAAQTGAALSTLDARLAELARAVGESVEQTGDSIRTLAAETERVEACTLVSLAKLADDITDIRGQQQPADPQWERDVAERLKRLEAAAETVVSTHAVEALRLQLAELRAHVVRQDRNAALAQRVDELFDRLGATEASNAEAFMRLHETIGALEPGRQAMATTGERLRAVEIAVAGLADRVEVDPSETVGQIALLAVETRIAEIEAAQASTLEAIHAQLAVFVDAVNRRMDALEASSDAAASISHMAAAFDAFREQIDGRIAYIEDHSVRALQHVAETVSVLEERFGGSERKAAAS